MSLPELPENVPSIPEFYNGKTLFITGFTGFLGKVLVEKLLWSCQGIEKIYVLMREKKGKSAEERLQDIINLPLFQRLREHRLEEVRRKLIIMKGDGTLPELGLSEEDKARLKKEVNIVFHVAASVRFDDPLTVAVDINLLSTKSLIDLALHMPNLVCFVHISTAYSNCDQKEKIQEELYPPHADWKKTLQVTRNLDPAILNVLTQKYIGNMPNTYVFVKSLAEHVVNDYSDRLPVLIIRPSIVISSYDDPISGWIDNINGPIGLLAGYSIGVIRTSLCDPSLTPDYMPVDIAIKVIIVATWRKGISKEPKRLTVFNCCSAKRSLTTNKLIEYGIQLNAKHPMKIMLWTTSTHYTPSKLSFTLNCYFRHVVPAFFIDILLRVIGRQPLLMKIQRRVYAAMMALAYFTLNRIEFHNEKILDMSEQLVKEDEVPFQYNKPETELDLFDLFNNATIGFQRYILKQTEADDAGAMIRSKILNVVEMVVRIMLWSLLLYYSYTYKVPQRIIQTLSASLRLL